MTCRTRVWRGRAVEPDFVRGRLIHGLAACDAADELLTLSCCRSSPAAVRDHRLDDLEDAALTRGDRAWIAFCAFLTLFVTGALAWRCAVGLFNLVF